MAVARVVEFDGVSSDRMEQLDAELREGEPPEGMPQSEIVVLHDAEAQKALVVVIFDSEEDYKRGDEILSAMPADDTPGQRTGVKKYAVAARMTG